MTETETAQNAEQACAELVSVVVQGETTRYQNYLAHKVGLQLVGPSRGYAGTTTKGRVWFMTEKLGLTVRLVPPEALARFLNNLSAQQCAAPTAPSPSAPGEEITEPPSPQRGNYVQALEESRRARRDGSRTSFEAYLVYKDGGRTEARLNRGHWQPDPLDTVAGLAEETRSALMADEWAPESYVDPRMFQDEDDSFERAGAVLPGSGGW